MRDILSNEGYSNLNRLDNHAVLNIIENLIKDDTLMLYDIFAFAAAENRNASIGVVQATPAPAPPSEPGTHAPPETRDRQLETADLKAIPQAEAKYKTQGAAAKAALEKANPQSIKDNLEYGGVIYRDKKTGEFGYTGPIKGTDQGVNPFIDPIPQGAELVGDYHTHADYSIVDRNTGTAIRTNDPLKDDFNSDNFSSEDIKGITADGKGNKGYKGYLGTPSGQFKVYDPAIGKKSLL